MKSAITINLKLILNIEDTEAIELKELYNSIRTAVYNHSLIIPLVYEAIFKTSKQIKTITPLTLEVKETS